MSLFGMLKRKRKRSTSAASESQPQGSAKDNGDAATEGEQLTLDKGLGPKILSDPEEQIVDIIFVHGLTGHRDRTWTAATKKLPWPEELLSQDIRDARIITYGYDADVVHLTQPAGQNTVREHAKNLLNDLANVRQRRPKSVGRPVIFVAHSLGGLICEDAIFTCNNPASSAQRDILNSVRGLIFLGTPHAGSDFTMFAKAVANIIGLTLVKAPNKNILQVLERNSEVLANIENDFLTLIRVRGEGGMGYIKLHSFVEELPVVATGHRVVTPESAKLKGYDFGTIPANHMDMTKISSRDTAYNRVKGVLDSWCEELRLESSEERDSSQLGLNEPNTKDQKNCLKYLYFEELEARQVEIKPAAANTCAWLLQHNTFREWTAQERGLLWISGNPGAGKSTLLKYALKKFDGLAVHNKALVLSFFFHGRGAEIQRTPLGFFRSILYQILRQVPSVLSELVLAFKKNCEEKGKPGKEWYWRLEELQGFLRSSLSKILERHSIRMFVDALDEGGESVAVELVEEFQNLLDCINPTRSRSTFSICFTCRHYPIIELKSGGEICVEKENSNDISTYVRDRLPNKENEIGDMIIQRASGIFQWVRLVVDRVVMLRRNGKPRNFIKQEIQRIPKDLVNLYRELLEGGSLEERSELLNLVQWILFAFRPLSLDELRFATAVEPNLNSPYKSLRQYQDAGILSESTDEMETRVKSVSRGLAEIQIHDGARIVQFIHQSVLDFLFSDGLQILLGDGWRSIDLAIGTAHYQLSRSCIRNIDMGEMDQPGGDDLDEGTNSLFSTYSSEEIELQGGEDFDPKAKFPFLEYATEYWRRHIKKSYAKGILQDDLLDYLHWPSDNFMKRWVRIYDMIHDFSNASPPKGTTLLHLASRYGLISPLSAALESLDQSLDHGENKVDSKDDHGQTPLSWAAENGHETVVKLLLATGKVKVNSTTNSGRTPLSWAAENGHETVVKLLLATGKVKVDSRSDEWSDEWSWTPLSLAALKGREAVVKLLLATGKVDINSRDRFGRTPISWAAENGHETVVKLLLATGKVDINSKDRDGKTPLLYAIEEVHEAVVKLLLATGKVDINSKEYRGRTPLSYATESRQEAVVKLLLATGKVDINSKDEHFGRTPLSYAAVKGYEAVVKLLLAMGKIDVDSKDKYDYRTPLSLAAGQGREAVVKLLLATGKVDINSKDRDGKTPLLYAIEEGHEGVVKLLQSYTATQLATT